jgi:LysM repeat protein
MSKWPASWRVILLFVFCCVLSGCLPVSDSPIDDEKDPNFIDARKLYNMMDWKGAVEAYERTIQANPRNATAHFELAVLYEQKMKDYVSAAFHYQKHLDLRPNSPYRETAKPRLEGCKMEIAKSVTYVVVNDQIHRDMIKLTNELGIAKKENEALRGQIAAKPMVVTQWMKFTVTNNFTNYIRVAAVQQNANLVEQPRAVQTNTLARTNTVPPRTTALPPANTNTTRRVTPPASGPVTRADIRPQAVTPSRVRAYTVRPGETMAEIARRFGVSLPRLQAANPSIQPRNLKPGQTVNIPAQ